MSSFCNKSRPLGESLGTTWLKVDVAEDAGTGTEMGL